MTHFTCIQRGSESSIHFLLFSDRIEFQSAIRIHSLFGLNKNIELDCWNTSRPHPDSGFSKPSCRFIIAILFRGFDIKFLRMRDHIFLQKDLMITLKFLERRPTIIAYSNLKYKTFFDGFEYIHVSVLTVGTISTFRW